MKGLLVLFTAMVFLLPSCTYVDSGHRGVEIKTYSTGTNLEKVYGEGKHWGLKWLWNDMVQYDVREVTLVEKFEFNDKNDMTTAMEVSLDFKLIANDVNKLHSTISDFKTKILKTLKSASKEVVPQYSAVELNKTKRKEAEEKLAEIVKAELPEFHVDYVRLQITDVDIPKAVADIAEQTAVQLQQNELASKKEAEMQALAKADVAKAKGKFEAAEYEAKAQEILSQPKMLERQKIENERLMWQGYLEHGTSPFGTHNMYGVTPSVLLQK